MGRTELPDGFEGRVRKQGRHRLADRRSRGRLGWRVMLPLDCTVKKIHGGNPHNEAKRTQDQYFGSTGPFCDLPVHVVGQLPTGLVPNQLHFGDCFEGKITWAELWSPGLKDSHMENFFER